jgi:Fe-S-cluster containining protein
MTDSWFLIAEAICDRCGGLCCRDAHPPLTRDRIDEIVSDGHPFGNIEYRGYSCLATGEDGMCVMFHAGRCRIQAIKPETCRAGPFTFDIVNGVLEIWLKHERICPLAGLLREEPEAYARLCAVAQDELLRLVRSLPSGDLAAICRIPEPDTDKIAEISLGEDIPC